MMDQKAYDEIMSGKFIQMTNIDVAYENEKYYLGDNDAETEWKDNPDLASRLFVHTKSYRDFWDKDALLLLGRTGTGKTAILRCMENEINNRKNGEFQFVITISLDEILQSSLLLGDIDVSSFQSRIKIEESLEWIINILVMKRVYLEDSVGVESIERYLNGQGLTDNASIFGKFKRIFNTAAKIDGKLGETAKNIELVAEIIETLNSTEYLSAKKDLYDYLNQRKTLVLIDSSNEYDMRDKNLVIIIKALISECFKYHNNRAMQNIYVKMAIPSEVYTVVLQTLPGKQRGNTVIIQWKYDDLVCFIARRFYCNLKDNKLFAFLKDFNLSDFDYENTEHSRNAHRMLNMVLPEYCSTSLNYKFHTLAYCIKHTLKKPREILTIFNALVDYMISQNDSEIFLKEQEEKVKSIVHSTQENLIGSALSMYDNTYPRIEEACAVVLRNKSYILKLTDIRDSIKEAVANVADSNYDEVDIKRILLESGLIGVITVADKFIKAHNDKMNNDEPVRAVYAMFEYQIKGRLSFNTKEYYVIHPMCYEHFTCSVNPDTLVYVDTNSDEQDIINTIINEK